MTSPANPGATTTVSTTMVSVAPRDGGSISVITAVLVPALLLVLALVADGGTRIRAIARADSLAAEAARAANTAVDTRSATITVDTTAAARTARDYLAHTGNPGTVTITGPRAVRVRVTITEPTPIGLLGPQARATGTAVAELGVGIRDGGLP